MRPSSKLEGFARQSIEVYSLHQRTSRTRRVYVRFYVYVFVDNSLVVCFCGVDFARFSGKWSAISRKGKMSVFVFIQMTVTRGKCTGVIDRSLS